MRRKSKEENGIREEEGEKKKEKKGNIKIHEGNSHEGQPELLDCRTQIDRTMGRTMLNRKKETRVNEFVI